MLKSSFLLDTSAAIALLNRDAAFLAHFPPEIQLALPVTALAELLFGAEKSQRRDENRKRIYELTAAIPVIASDTATADVWAALRESLRTKGTPIPQNDLWIAAGAIQHDYRLITRDAHFYGLPGLKSISW